MKLKASFEHLQKVRFKSERHPMGSPSVFTHSKNRKIGNVAYFLIESDEQHMLNLKYLHSIPEVKYWKMTIVK